MAAPPEPERAPSDLPSTRPTIYLDGLAEDALEPERVFVTGLSAVAIRFSQVVEMVAWLKAEHARLLGIHERGLDDPRPRHLSDGERGRFELIEELLERLNGDGT